jgi:predicted DNA-binding protein
MCIIYVKDMSENMQVRHNITIDKEISDELETVAKELGEKKSYLIEKALTVYFALLDLKLAKKRLRDLEKGRDRIIDSDEVWKKLGI